MNWNRLSGVSSRWALKHIRNTFSRFGGTEPLFVHYALQIGLIFWASQVRGCGSEGGKCGAHTVFGNSLSLPKRRSGEKFFFFFSCGDIFPLISRKKGSASWQRQRCNWIVDSERVLISWALCERYAHGAITTRAQRSPPAHDLTYHPWASSCHFILESGDRNLRYKPEFVSSSCQASKEKEGFLFPTLPRGAVGLCFFPYRSLSRKGSSAAFRIISPSLGKERSSEILCWPPIQYAILNHKMFFRTNWN